MYFRNSSKVSSASYWDGGLCHNNPALVAREEIFKIWPQIGTAHPDVLLSIGSGYQDGNFQPEEHPKG